MKRTVRHGLGCRYATLVIAILASPAAAQSLSSDAQRFGAMWELTEERCALAVSDPVAFARTLRSRDPAASDEVMATSDGTHVVVRHIVEGYGEEFWFSDVGPLRRVECNHFMHDVDFSAAPNQQNARWDAAIRAYMTTRSDVSLAGGAIRQQDAIFGSMEGDVVSFHYTVHPDVVPGARSQAVSVDMLPSSFIAVQSVRGDGSTVAEIFSADPLPTTAGTDAGDDQGRVKGRDRATPAADLARGGLFCDAVTALAGERVDPNADALLILGPDEGETRFFGYDVWFGNGHNCRATGRFVREGERWGYSDATCALQLTVTADGVTLQAPDGSCVTGCGARARLGGLSASWASSRTAAPDVALLERMDEACTMALPDVTAVTPGPSDAVSGAAPQIADTYSLPEAVAAPFRAQRILNTLGYSLGAIDGQFGSASRAALEAFLDDQGQAPSGLTSDALAVLERAFANRPAAPRSDDPAEVVRDIYQPEPKVGIFAFTQRADWFTPETLDLIAAAEIAYTRRFGIDGFDWNPIVPGNAFNVTDVSVEPRRIGDDEADILVRFRSFGEPIALTYRLSRALGQWRIHDIANGSSSLRADLAAAL